jgi:hypothetical protein
LIALLILIAALLLGLAGCLPSFLFFI